MVSNPAAVLSYGHSHVLNVVHVLTYSTVHRGSLEKKPMFSHTENKEAA
jgi:hypothetical protein